jgi:hypothetical protein
MKLTTNLLIVLIVLITGTMHIEVYGQVPKGINFQAMARQADGRPVANKQVSVRISIANGSATGNKEYVEQHFPTTNALGLFDLVIGKGNLVSGSFTAINWAASNKWIQVELDPNGANNFILMGSQQMMSVPYSIYADIAGNVINYKGGVGISIQGDVISNTGDADNDPDNELIQSFQLSDDNILTLSDAGGNKTIDLSKYDNQPLNLADVLALGSNAGGLRISNLGNPENNQDAATKIYVDNLDIRDEDADPTNEIQDLALTDNVLKISHNETATEIDLSVYLDNTDNQNLSLTGTSLSISDGNTVDLSVVNTDHQELSISSNELIISGGNRVDLSPYLDNTDEQQLSISNNELNISGGNSVDLSPYLDNTDEQQLSISNNELNISGGNSVDLSPYLDNTDNQTLNISSDNLTISGGNSVSLSTYKQVLSLAGNTLSISGGTSSVSLAVFRQNLSDVLGQGNDANMVRIRNVGTPIEPSDAATVAYVDQKFSGLTLNTQMSVDAGDEINTSTASATNHYAFKVSTTFSGIGINSPVSLTRITTGFDDAGLINQNKFVAAADGVYQFTVNASSTDATAVLKVRINGNSMNNIMRVNNGLFQESLLFKLNANDYLEILIDQGSSANLSGTFFGYKL